jgi:hypothetical protein
VLQIKLVSIPRDVAREEIQANPDLIHYAKLSIVDLAGSERASRTQSQATRLREAANINLSLTTFHRCLEALRQQQVEQQQLAAQPRGRRGQSAAKPNGAITMAPFRESQLTRLFQDYFVGEGVASMIVNVNPLAAEFDETSQVLKMSSLAQDVVIESRTDTGRGGAQQPSAAIVAQQQEQMAQVRQAQAQLIRLQMQAAGGATYDAEQQVVLDNDVFNALVEELDDLKDELLDASHEAAAIEARVRLEASNELAERLARLDDTFRVRLHSEVEAVEEKYRSKLAIAQRYQEHMHVRDNEKAGELHKAFEFVKGENEKLEQQISALRVKLSDREALLAKTAEQTGMALGAVQAERTRLESEMAANAERFDSVVASRQMENENLRAQLADAKQDAASAKHDAARAEAESRRLATQVKHLMEERDALQSECNDWRKQMSGASAKSRQAPKIKEVVEQAPPPKRRLRSRQALDKSPNKKVAEPEAAAADDVDEEYMLKDGQMLWKGAVDMSVTGQGISVTFAEPVPVDVDEPATHDDNGFGNMNNDNDDDDDDDDEDEHTATRFATVKMMDDSMLFSAVASPAIKTPMPKARSTEKVSEKAPTALRSRSRTVGCENDPDSPAAAASPVAQQRVAVAPPKSVKKVQTSISQFAKPAAVAQPAMMAESTDAANEWSELTLSEKALSSAISASGATTSTSGARRRFFPATYSKKASAPTSVADQKTLDAAFGFSSSKDRAAANKHAVVTKFQRPASQRTIDAPVGPAPVRGKSGGVARLGKAFMNKLRGNNDDEDEEDIEEGDSGAKKVRRKPAFRRQPSKAAWSEVGEVENRNAQGSPY